MLLSSRLRLLTLMPRLGVVGVELGVASGAFSAELLAATSPCGRHYLARLYSIDRWADHHDATEEAAARALLAPYGDRSGVIRATFAEAVDRFADHSLGFIYIDGYAHTGQEGGATLREWWPKLAPGGVFAGHDYHPAWPETMTTVDAFARAHGGVHGLTASDSSGYPSWWMIKR